jgi:hypothetical protein
VKNLSCLNKKMTSKKDSQITKKKLVESLSKWRKEQLIGITRKSTTELYLFMEKHQIPTGSRAPSPVVTPSALEATGNPQKTSELWRVPCTDRYVEIDTTPPLVPLPCTKRRKKKVKEVVVDEDEGEST